MNKAALTLVALAAIAMHAHAEPSIFGTATTDVRVEIKKSSHGCFHNKITDYSFARGILSENNTEGLRLSQKQIANLDAYFDFVRTYGNKHGCTTTDNFKIDRYEHGQLVSSETLTDSTCIMSAKRLLESHPGVTASMQTPAGIMYKLKNPDEFRDHPE